MKALMQGWLRMKCNQEGPEGVKWELGFARFQCWELGFSCLLSLGMGFFKCQWEWKTIFKDCDWDFKIFC